MLLLWTGLAALSLKVLCSGAVCLGSLVLRLGVLDSDFCVGAGGSRRAVSRVGVFCFLCSVFSGFLSKISGALSLGFSGAFSMTICSGSGKLTISDRNVVMVVSLGAASGSFCVGGISFVAISWVFCMGVAVLSWAMIVVLSGAVWFWVEWIGVVSGGLIFGLDMAASSILLTSGVSVSSGTTLPKSFRKL